MATIGGPVIPGVTDGLVLYLDAAVPESYPGTGTTWTDLSNSKYTGSLVNGPTHTGFNKQSSIGFDGTDDAVNLNDIIFSNSTSNVTIDIWVSFPSMTVNRSFMAKGSGGDGAAYTFITTTGLGASGGSSAYVRFFMSNGTAASTTIEYANLIYGQFYNFTYTYNGSQIVGYRNGESPISQSLAGPLYYSNTPLYLGRNKYGNNAPCNIAIFKIYNRPLTATEVLQNYNATKSRFGL